MGSMLPLTAILNPSGGEQEAPSNARPSPSTAINFYPFEDLDEASIREIRKYQIHSFGRIRDSCRRIPYNTGKRDFYEKTGRTCFEVFQYDFKIPGNDTTWTVMWDYKIGLVRTTPFFKCCDYSKTISAKMLNQNPGLRDISHSITGGAIRAQGYWMPFGCARAVCATFCYPISGALIPLFGPIFPSECIPPNTQHYARMTISPAIIQRSKREAEEFRRLYGNMPSPPTPSLPSSSTTRTHGHGGGYRIAPAYHHPQSDRHHHHGCQTGTDSDAEGSSLDRFPRLPPLQTAHLPTPALSSAESSYNAASSTAQSSPRFWTAVNHPRAGGYPAPHYASSYGHEWQQRHGGYDHSKPQSRYHHLEPDPYRSAVSSPHTSAGTSHHQFYHQPPPQGLPLPSSDSTSSREAPPSATGREVLPPYRSVARGVGLNTSTCFSPRYGHGDKRPFDDYDYDAGESANGSSPEAPSPKVFHGSSSKSYGQVQSQRQQQITTTNLKPPPVEVESRRCSLVVVGANYGSDTSRAGGRSKNATTASSSKESDRTSESSSAHERDEREARAKRMSESSSSCTLAPIVYRRGSTHPCAAAEKSPPSHSSKSKDDRASGDRDRRDKRTPSFSGAERVAALTLLHLGILEEQGQQQQHSKQNELGAALRGKSRRRRSSKGSDAEMLDDHHHYVQSSSYSPHRRNSRGGYSLPLPSPPRHETSTYSHRERETIFVSPGRTPKELGYAEVFESTGHASPPDLVPRRGSRDRKRRKGRSI